MFILFYALLLKLSPICPFVMCLLFSKYILTSWCYKRFQAHFVFSVPQPWNEPFPYGALVLFTREW